jgi:hypothetical protein
VKRRLNVFIDSGLLSASKKVAYLSLPRI